MSTDKGGKNPEKDAVDVMESEGGAPAAVPPAEESKTNDESCARCGGQMEIAAAEEIVHRDGKAYCSSACAQGEAPLRQDQAKEPEQEEPGMPATGVQAPPAPAEGRRHGKPQPAAHNNEQKSKQPHEPAGHARKR